nr:MAG TPA: hypothetical protein [Bacteriophage sp.]
MFISRNSKTNSRISYNCFISTNTYLLLYTFTTYIHIN